MILDQRTQSVLKNFATINPSIQFKEGDVLSTISPQKTVMARAKLDQSFERTFAIYDLSRFLGVLSLFNQPELITENESFVTIRDGRQKVKYMFADASMIAIPPDKAIKLPTVDVQFTLAAEAFTRLMKALSVMQMPEIAMTGDGETIRIETADTKGAVQDSFSIDVGDTDRIFKVILRAENLKLMTSGYDVKISRSGLVHFANADGNLEYWIAAESSSSFQD